MRTINQEIQTNVFNLILACKGNVTAQQAFAMVRALTDETADDLIPELAHCAKQARNALNEECFDYFNAVLSWAMQN